MTYGGFFCDTDEPNNKICTNENSESKYGYLILEKIQESETLEKVLENLQKELLNNQGKNFYVEIQEDQTYTKLYVNILAQVLTSLTIVYNQKEFTHYDLNFDNILLTKYTEPRILEYTTDKFFIKIDSKYLVQFIDFNLSYVKDHPLCGINTYSHYYQEYGFITNVSNINFDLYHFSMTFLYQLMFYYPIIFTNEDNILKKNIMTNSLEHFHQYLRLIILF